MHLESKCYNVLNLINATGIIHENINASLEFDETCDTSPILNMNSCVFGDISTFSKAFSALYTQIKSVRFKSPVYSMEMTNSNVLTLQYMNFTALNRLDQLRFENVTVEYLHEIHIKGYATFIGLTVEEQVWYL